MFIWLQKGGKYSSFDRHRQFLPLDHPFKQDIKNFTKGIVTYASKTEPAYSFDHYVVASDAEYPNKAARVKAEFWVSLPCTTLLNTSHSLDFS